MRRALIFAALFAVSCSDGTDGAVSVRWRIVDLTTGATYDPRQHTDPNVPGGCSCPQATISGDCPASPGWRIGNVRVLVRDPVTEASALREGGLALDQDPAFVFACSQREATTPFRVPPGTWALSLSTFNETPGAADGGTIEDPSGVTPPPVVRTVRPSEIVNLDLIEIGVDPLPTGPAPDGGATDAGVM